MNDKELADRERVMALVADLFPAHWRRVYLSLCDENFTKDEAMQLLIAYIQKP